MNNRSMYCLHRHRSDLVTDLPNIKDNKKSTIKMKNKIFAIEAAPDAIPPKPNIAAMMATTKNITVQRNISFKFKRLLNNYFVLKN